MQKYNNSQGICPACKGFDLTFKPLEDMANQVYEEIECNQCGFKGKQWYKLNYEYTEEIQK